MQTPFIPSVTWSIEQLQALDNLLAAHHLTKKRSAFIAELNEARERYRSHAALDDPSAAQLRRQLTRIDKSLEVIAQALRQIPPHTRRLLDQHYFLANDDPLLFFVEDVERLNQSGAELLTLRFQRGVHHWNAKLETEPPARKRDNARIYAVSQLCTQLGTLTNGRFGPSCGDHTFCYELTQLFCRDVLGHNIESVERILEAALKR